MASAFIARSFPARPLAWRDASVSAKSRRKKGRPAGRPKVESTVLLGGYAY